jgi:transposase
MRVQRVKCHACGCEHQEHIPFTTGKRHTTHRLERLVVDLMCLMTISEVAAYLKLSWNTVKDIHKNYLEHNYAHPDISKVRYIGIDEFAVRKGHVYKTIVVDLETGRIIYVGDGKGADALDKFWKRVKKYGTKIEYIATDLSAAFISAVKNNAPDAELVFDHYHVKKQIGDAVDKVRRSLYHDKLYEEKKDVIKGARWLLLKNSEDIKTEDAKKQLQEALSINEPLAKAYYLKEEIMLVWAQPDKKTARAWLYGWISRAIRSGNKHIIKAGMSMFNHREGILAWYDHKITTAMVEGINNKIKVMKREAYGFTDDHYFELRLLALHDAGITPFL